MKHNGINLTPSANHFNFVRRKANSLEESGDDDTDSAGDDSREAGQLTGTVAAAGAAAAGGGSSGAGGAGGGGSAAAGLGAATAAGGRGAAATAGASASGADRGGAVQAGVGASTDRIGDGGRGRGTGAVDNVEGNHGTGCNVDGPGNLTAGGVGQGLDDVAHVTGLSDTDVEGGSSSGDVDLVGLALNQCLGRGNREGVGLGQGDTGHGGHGDHRRLELHLEVDVKGSGIR